MKKMSEVFELPINHEYLEVYGPERAGITYAEAEKHAAHAINHVDALAEALEAIVSDYNQYRAVNGIDLTDDHCAKLDVKMATAEAALAAYRGEK